MVEVEFASFEFEVVRIEFLGFLTVKYAEICPLAAGRLLSLFPFLFSVSAETGKAETWLLLSGFLLILCLTEHAAIGQINTQTAPCLLSASYFAHSGYYGSSPVTFRSTLF